MSSIALRLVAWFTLASAVLLGAVVGLVYRGVARHIEEEHLHLLAQAVRLVRASLAAQTGTGLAGDLPGVALALADEGDHGERYSFRLVAPDGSIAAESPGMARVPAAVLATVPVAAPQEPVSGRAWHAPDGSHLLLGAAVLPAVAGAGGPNVVHASLDITEDDKLLAGLWLQGLVVLALGVIASGVAGAAIARWSLRPIGRLTAAMSEVSARRLDRGVDPGAFPVELWPLASAFDDMLARLDRAFADVSAYCGNLAHELRTPLGNLRGEAEVALLRERTVAEYREVLSSSLEELDRLARTIDALLFLARADHRETVLARSPVELGAEVRGVAEYFAGLAEEKSATLQVCGEAVAEVDAELLRRALANLLSNALRYVERGGRVVVTVATDAQGWASVAVADNGGGIAPDDLPRIFERFYRGSPAAAGGPGGTGLGLAIVRSIAELHGGRVEIASALGAGTTVTLSFPGRCA